MIVPPVLQSQPVSSRTAIAQVPRRWLALARGTWIVCALLLLANFVASIPAYYRLMLTVCTLPNPEVSCTISTGPTSGQLTPLNVQALAHLHLSLTAYVVYYVTLQVMVSLLYWVVGLLIFWRKSDEGMGLLVSLLLVYFGSTSVTQDFLGAWAPTHSPLLLIITFAIISIAAWIGLGAFLLTFPTGRFVPRWSWLLILLWAFTSLPIFPALQGIATVLAFIGTLGIMIYRYVRVFDAIQRQQTKWFLYVVATAIFLVGSSSQLLTLVLANSPYQLLNGTLSLLFFAFIPFGLGIAILRSRLWDIDVLINRTLVYGSLTAILVLLYVGLIFALQSLFQGIFKQNNNDVTIVISTLAIAALVQPLRRRLQQIIDRRFYRSKYNATRTLAKFNVTLRDEVDLQQLQASLVAVVEETMQPTHVSLWVRPTQPDKKHEAAWTDKSLTPRVGMRSEKYS